MRRVCLQFQDAVCTVEQYMREYDTAAGNFVKESMYDVYMAPTDYLMYAWLPEVFMAVVELWHISVIDLRCSLGF